MTKKGLLSSGSLSLKYDVLNKIGSSNWAPTNHSLGITTTYAKLIFQMGTKAKMNFGEYVFKKTMKHVDSFDVRLPIIFPYLLIGIILNQQSKAVHHEEAQS